MVRSEKPKAADPQPPRLGLAFRYAGLTHTELAYAMSMKFPSCFPLHKKIKIFLPKKRFLLILLWREAGNGRS